MDYQEEVLRLTNLYDKVELMRLPRGDRNHVDAQARLASSLETQDSRVIPVEYYEKPSVSKTEQELLNIIEGYMDGPIYSLSKQ